ncbi:MAG: hypothetical protein IIX36_07010 [Clostridia bacterium]|nr:hypothetical protein [Clostridia bacterium]
MKFSDNKKLYIRRALFIVLTVLTAAFQHTDAAVPDFFGAKAMLLIPLCVSIAMFEKSMGGLTFGVICGALWDSASAAGDGFFSVTLAVAGFLAGVAITYLMRNNIFSALILSGVSTLAVNTAYWVIFVLMKGYEGAWSLLSQFYLPSAFYSVLFTFIYYYLVRFIVQLTPRDKTIRSV